MRLFVRIIFRSISRVWLVVFLIGFFRSAGRRDNWFFFLYIFV